MTVIAHNDGVVNALHASSRGGRSVLLRLAGAALLLLAALASVAGPARAQTTTTEVEIWSATLVWGGTVTGYENHKYRDILEEDFGSLSPNTFVYGGTTYEISRLYNYELAWLPSDMKLGSGTFAVYVGSTRYEFNESESAGGVSLGLITDDVFSVGQTVAVRLVRVVENTSAELSSLDLQAPNYTLVALSPAFSASTTSYTATAPGNAAFVTVHAPGASVSITPTDEDSARPGSQVRLTPGQTRTVTVNVTAGDGTTMKTYTVAVTRPETDVCQRILAVRDAIMAAIPGATGCTDVTAAQLRGIRVLPGGGASIKSSHFRRGDFAGMPGLLELSLEPTLAETLPVGLFDGLTGLKKIWIQGGVALTRLPRGLFAGLSSLEVLTLNQHGRLTTLPVGLFDGLPRLKLLNLSRLGAVALPAGLFRNLPALEEFYLSGSGLTTLPVGVFDGLAGLRYLSVNSDLEQLPVGIFDDLGRLESLGFSGNALTSLPPGLFDALGRLQKVFLYNNDLTSLPPGLFDRLPGLEGMALDGNEIDSLPPGIFGKLTGLRQLELGNNPGLDSFVPVAEAGSDLRVEPGGEVALAGGATGPWDDNVLWSWEQVDAEDTALATPTVTLSGADTASPTFTAPDEMGTLYFRLTATGRGTDDPLITLRTGTDTVTVQVSTEAAEAVVDTLAAFALSGPGGAPVALSPKFDPGTSAYTAVVAPGTGRVTLTARPTDPAAQVQYGPETDASTAPGHQAALPPGLTTRLTATAVSVSGGESMLYTVEVTHPATDLCGRTPEVRDAILAKLSDVTDCVAVTAAHLAGIAGSLPLDEKSIDSLKAGDFAGLSGLTYLDLAENELTGLPAGLFDGLEALRNLFLNENPLMRLPPGIFDGLAELRDLHLSNTDLVALPAGLLDNQSKLYLLYLDNTDLAALPDGIFEPLGALNDLFLSGSPGSADFVPAADAGPDRTAAVTTAVTLDGRASVASGPWKSNVTGWLWQQVDASNNVLTPPTVTLTGANTPTPSFTAPSSVGDVHLRLTVTGRGATGVTGHYRGSDTVTVTVQAATDVATDAALAGLSLVAPDGSLVPLRDAGSLAETAFAAETVRYKAVLPAGAGQVTVAAVPRSAGATAAITPADADADAGNGHQVAVAPGQTLSIAVTVTAADGATAKIWTVEAQRSAPMAICDRTPAVRDAILAKLSDVTDCAAVTAAHLAGIGTLPLDEKGIASLKAGDFAGLTGLTYLDLAENELTGLPAGLFDGLEALRDLFLNENPLMRLPPGIFDGLAELRDLHLSNTDLAALPAGLLDNQSKLYLLYLENTDLAALPDGIFEPLGALNELFLSGSPGSADFVPAADAGPDRTAAAATAVTLDGRASLASGPWKSNVTGWLWQQVDASNNLLATVTLTGANTRTPSFTAPSAAGDVHLRLTVTGRGATGVTGQYRGSDTVTITVQVVTDAATDAELAGLTLAAPDGSPVPLRDAGSLAETAFAAATASYKAVLPAAAASVTVAAALRSAGGAAAITPADADANASNGHQVAVAPGRTQSIAVMVTAADGATVKTWTVEAQRSAAPPTDVCARTPEVRDAIVTAVTAVTDCAAVTAAHLAGIAGSLDLNDMSIASLKAGDFTGLIRLTGLRLDGNRLSSLPAGLFDATTLLTSLRLDGNLLSSLPAGLFEPLTVLSDLRLSGNLGSSGFLPVVEAGPDLRVETGAAFALSGAPNAASPWGENVTWEWSQTGGTDTALSDTARPDPTATATATAGDLFFQLKAIGRGGELRILRHGAGAGAQSGRGGGAGLAHADPGGRQRGAAPAGLLPHDGGLPGAGVPGERNGDGGGGGHGPGGERGDHAGHGRGHERPRPPGAHPRWWRGGDCGDGDIGQWGDGANLHGDGDTGADGYMRSDAGGTGRDPGGAFRCDGLRGGDRGALGGDYGNPEPE